EAGHQVLDVLVDEGVQGDARDKVRVVRGRGQLAREQQAGDLQVVAPLRELLDRIAPVAQDPLFSVDEGDAAAAGGGVHVGRVVGHQAEIVVGDLDAAKVHRPDGPVIHGQLVRAARTVV